MKYTKTTSTTTRKTCDVAAQCAVHRVAARRHAKRVGAAEEDRRADDHRPPRIVQQPPPHKVKPEREQHVAHDAATRSIHHVATRRCVRAPERAMLRGMPPRTQHSVQPSGMPCSAYDEAAFGRAGLKRPLCSGLAAGCRGYARVLLDLNSLSCKFSTPAQYFLTLTPAVVWMLDTIG